MIPRFHIYLRFKTFFIILLLLVASCSSTRIAYGFLDWAMGWQIGKYVDLNSEQDHFAKTKIDEFHAWHRKTQLPVYAEYITGLKKRLLSGEVTGQQIHDETDQIQIYLDLCIEKLLPALAELSSTFSDKQAEEIQKNLKEEREKYKKKYVDVDENKTFKLREKELNKHLKRLIGSLNDKQKKWLREWSRSLQPYEKLTLDQQKEWAKRADEALKARDDKAKLEEQLKALMFYHSENWGEDAELLLDINQELTYNFIARVFNNLDDKQKKHLADTLDNYVKDFTALTKVDKK